MKKLICSTIVLIGIASIGFAQGRSKSSDGSSYQSGIGIRVGSGYYDLISASFKTFIASSPGAIELNLGFKPDNYYYNYYNSNGVSVSFAASYQYHFDIGQVEGLKWFVGGGAIVSNTSHYGFGFGVFPVGGVDYKFSSIPLNVSADVRPIIGIVRPTDYYNTFYPSVGLSARYTF